MTTATIDTISTEELSAKMGNADAPQVINVLEPDHPEMIAGTRRLPLSQLEGRMSELDKSREVITYCAGPTCPLSRQAAEKLAQNGYQVRAYVGGLKEWKDSGLPME